MDIGTKIKAARIAKGYTQAELGEKLGVCKSAISKWEKGAISNIGRKRLQLLADTLGISPYELVKPEEKSLSVEDASFHAKILQDDDLLEALKDFYRLSDTDRNTILSLIHSLATKKD